MSVASRMARVVVVAVTVAAASPAASAAADPPPTQVITAVAVGPGGQPINGYSESPPQGNVSTVDDCTTPSPSAVADDVYYCSPSAAGAGTCWPSSPGSLLCVNDPWQKRLHRVNYSGPLPPVHPPATVDPFALTLDDGTQCLFRNGGAWGGRADGYEGVYSCGPNLQVLWLPSQGAGSCIDRSSAVWTVKVGQLGAPGAAFPPPQTRAVSSAWFAGGKAGQ